MISDFGALPDGRSVKAVVLRNDALEVRLITLGASVQSVVFGGVQQVISGDSLDDYLGRLKYAGAIVGRVANRIASARAEIAGVMHRFDANEANGNCLHGGRDGAGQMLWEVADLSDTSVTFALHMPDGHMGFPGALDVRARYELSGSTLRLEITATSDAETLCSFAPHGYWTLGSGDIGGLEMQVLGAGYLPVDADNIPTGQIAPVAESALDFRDWRAIGSTVLDHNFCVGEERSALRPVCRLRNPASGVALEVSSTEAGVQIYDARHLGRAGVAIEPQVWPDSPNQDGFPSMVLKPRETYRAVSEFRLYNAV